MTDEEVMSLKDNEEIEIRDGRGHLLYVSTGRVFKDNYFDQRELNIIINDKLSQLNYGDLDD